MRNLTPTKYLLLTFSVIILALSSCKDSKFPLANNSPNFTIKCKLEKSIKKDSASLFVVDQLLGCKRLITKIGSQDGVFCFTGQIDAPHVGIIEFKNESRPFYFIIEPGATDIEFTPKKIIVVGRKDNHEYFSFVQAIKLLQEQRKSNFKAYCKEASDSTLTAKKEENYKTNDHKLYDSIQSLSLKYINANNYASQIIKERYMYILDSINIKKIQDAH